MYCSKLSDAECLQESLDFDSDKIDHLSTDVLERKVKSLEKENRDMSRRFQGVFFVVYMVFRVEVMCHFRNRGRGHLLR